MTSLDTLPRTPGKTAETTAPLHPLLAQRWSPRAFDPAHELDDVELTSLLEAARWAPSANNSQPWRFLVARRGDVDFVRVSDLLSAGNQLWAPRASALVVAVAQVVDETGRPRPWALYDTGQAVAALSLQAEAMGLAVHQMGGFDADGVRHELGLDDTLAPVVVLAVGRHDPDVELPEPLAARERAPRAREPLAALLLHPNRSGTAAVG